MKLTKNKIRKLIKESLLKEFKDSDEQFIIPPSKLKSDFNIEDYMYSDKEPGGGDPPDKEDNSGGGGESCSDFGEKYNDSYLYVLDVFNLAYPYNHFNPNALSSHAVFLNFIQDSGITLPEDASIGLSHLNSGLLKTNKTKDAVDYVSDEVIHGIALDVCRMFLPKNEAFLMNLFKSPFTLLQGVEFENGTKSQTYLPGSKIKKYQ